MEILPIFVYGTLRGGHENYDILDLKVENVRDGIAQGTTLYHLDTLKFPFAVFDNSENYVYGELMHILPDEYESIMKKLDSLEGYTGDPSTSMYVRDKIEITDFETNEKTTAWMYIASPSYAAMCENEAEQIENGDWELYCQKIMDMEFDSFEDESIEATLAREDAFGYTEEDYMRTSTRKTGSMSYSSSKSYSSVQPAKKSTSTTSQFKMEKGTDKDVYVWYVAYGSNLNVDRFLKYMNVGRYAASDKFVAEDLDSVQVQVPHGIFFAKSGRWGNGGIAFLDVDTTEDFTCALRAYKLTVQQFWSLVCQENGSRSIKLDWEKMQDNKFYDAPNAGLYTRVANLGTIEGIPAFTVTNSQSFSSMLASEKTQIPHQYLELGMLNPPSHEYLNTINEGADQTAKLDSTELIPFKPKPKKDKTTAQTPSNVVQFNAGKVVAKVG